MTDYTRDILAFYSDLYHVEGSFGPQAVITPEIRDFLKLAFPDPDGHPAVRNILISLPKKQGKSTLAGMIGTYISTRSSRAEVAIVAADRDQAKDRILRSIKYAVEVGPLAKHAHVTKTAIEFDNGSVITAYPNHWQSAAGGNYAAVLFDELHAWTYESDRRMFDEMVIPPTQPHGVRIMASYAGFEGESLLLREWWDRSLQGERIHETLPIYLNREASLLAWIDTGTEAHRMPWMTPEYIQEIQSSERPNTYRRIWLNEWVSNQSQFLPDGAWAACYSDQVRPLQSGDRRRVVLGADASTSRDYTALVGVEYSHGSALTDVVYTRVWKPRRSLLRAGKPTIDLEATLGAEVIRLHEAGQLDAVVCDPYQMHSMMISWQKLGIRVIEFPQGRRVEADQGLYDAVIGRVIRHYNDPELNDHVQHAVAIETVRGWKLDKAKTSQKIDAAVALAMAHHGALAVQKQGGEAQSIPNIFYDYEGHKFSDFTRAGQGWVLTNNVNPHPPGVTWRNCRHRNEGCQACINELTTEGWYEAIDQQGDELQRMDDSRRSPEEQAEIEAELMRIRRPTAAANPAQIRAEKVINQLFDRSK